MIGQNIKTTAIEISATSPHLIYGTHYSRINGTRSRQLIINIHGLTHNQWGHLQLNSTAPFTAAGYDVFNFSFYDRQPKSRRLSASTLTTHVDDLSRVIRHFQGKYKSICLTGHSLGGLVALILNPKDVRAASFWDPSFDVTYFWETSKCLTPLQEYDAFRLDYGAEYMIGAEMVREIANYPNNKCITLARKFHSPAQLIIPEQSIFLASPHSAPSQYTDAFTQKSELINIDETDHCFYGPYKDQELFQATLNWFNRFS